MKKIFYLMLLTLLISIWSCEDSSFLEKAPGIDVTEDTIFSSAAQTELFLNTIYQYGMHSNLPYYNDDGIPNIFVNPEGHIGGACCDEAEQCADWYPPQKWNTGSITADNTEDARWVYRWKAIRYIAVMLERVDEVPDMSPDYAKQIKAEVKFLRALNYFEMMKRYGGVPVIDHSIKLDEDLKIPRSTLEETYNFIMKDLKEAIPDLQSDQAGALRGRAHKGAALALKSKTMLYAASKMFNTSTPFMSLGANNNLICFGNYKIERWQEAAQAAYDVLEWAKEAGYHLITDQGVDENYRYSWEHYDNAEIIFAEKSNGKRGRWTWPWSSIAPPTIAAGNSGYSGVTPTLNFVSKYEDRQGRKVDWSGGTGLQAKMANLDRRFNQTVVGNLGYWNVDCQTVELFEGGKHTTSCFGGFWLHKLYPREISQQVWSYQPNSTLFQLNEIYLNFAEAMTEAYGPDDPQSFGMTARDAINIIRDRSGQPKITSGSGIYSDFMELIRNERALELAFDEHRFWDVRRWLIADQEGIMQGAMKGIKIYKDTGNEYSYEPYVFETRTFMKRMYLHPVPTGEINKGYLIQNPGY